MSLMAAIGGVGHPLLAMTAKHPDGKNAPEARRVRRLVEALEAESSAAFALWLGIDPRRWNNFEVGYPLSKEIAKLLVRKVPGLTYEWLFDGNADRLSIELAQRLGELPRASKKRKPVQALPRARKSA